MRYGHCGAWDPLLWPSTKTTRQEILQPALSEGHMLQLRTTRWSSSWNWKTPKEVYVLCHTGRFFSWKVQTDQISLETRSIYLSCSVQKTVTVTRVSEFVFPFKKQIKTKTMFQSRSFTLQSCFSYCHRARLSQSIFTLYSHTNSRGPHFTIFLPNPILLCGCLWSSFSSCIRRLRTYHKPSN